MVTKDGPCTTPAAAMSSPNSAVKPQAAAPRPDPEVLRAEQARRRDEIQKDFQAPAMARGSSQVTVGTLADTVREMRGEVLSTNKVGHDDQGLLVEWRYSDATYLMARRLQDGIYAYRVLKITPQENKKNVASANRPTQTAAATPQPSAVVGSCDKHPTEVFPVGETFESDALSRRTDNNCPNARFHSDERIEVSFGGQRYFVQTKKLNFTGPAFYKILSIKGAER